MTSKRSARQEARFRILRPLGAGGSARVFLAEDNERGGARVALKLLRSPDSGALRAAQREFSQLARLGHPHVVKVFDLGRMEDGTLFLTAEVVEGEGLGRWWNSGSPGAPRRGARNRNSSDDRERVEALVQVCRALLYLHSRGIVHGDIKPENVLVTTSGSEEGHGFCAKLVDFGLATLPSDRTESEGVSGTLRYMAPEVLEGQRASPASDLYSLGALIAELALRDETTDGTDLSQRLASIQRWLAAEQPSQRPASAQGVIDALSHELGEDFSLSREELAGPYFPTVPFVGRQRELDQLETAPGGVVLIRGAEGCGKSSLLRELRVRALLEERPCLLGVHSEVGGPLQAVWNSLGTGTRSLDAGETAGAMDRAVDAVVCRVTRSGARPLLLLDDVLADDELSLCTLARLARSGQTSVTCCATVGAGQWSEQHQQLLDQGATLLTLSGLTVEDLTQLLQGMLPDKDHPAEQVAEIHSATRGNPRMVEEVVRLAIESGQLATGEQQYAVDVKHASLSGLAASRVEHLEPGERRQLTELSFFSLGAPPPLAPVLPHLEQRGLVTRTRYGWVRLANRWLQEALLGRVGRSQRTAGHEQLADRLASHEGKRDQPILWELELAEQLLGAGRQLQAATRILEVAKNQADRFELSAAARHFRRAAELSRGHGSVLQMEALAGLSRTLRTSGSLAQALSAHEQLLQQLDEAAVGSVRQEAELELSETLVAMGRHEEAIRNLEQICTGGDASADQIPAGLAARARLLWAKALIQQGDYSSAEAQALSGLEGKGQESLGRPLRADLQHLVGLCRMMQGSEGSVECFDEALEIYQEQGSSSQSSLHGAARTINSRGMALQRQGDLEQAAAAYAQSQDLFRQLNDLRSQSLATLNLGTVAQQRLQYDQALQHYRQGMALCRDLGHGLDLSRVQLNLGNLMIQLGDLEEAAHLLGQAEANAAGHGAQEIVAHARLFSAEVALLGEEANAREMAEASAKLFEELGLSSGQLEADLLAAQACLARQLWSDADRFVQRVERSRGERTRELAAKEQLVAGRLLVLRPGGDLQRGRLRLQEALLSAQQSGSALLEWQTHQALAEAGADKSEREYHQGRASVALDQMRCLVPEPFREAFDRAYVSSDQTRSAPAPGPFDTEGDREREQVLLGLLRINRELTREHQPDRVLELIVDRAIELTGAERGFVILAGDGERALTVELARNIDQETLRRKSFKFSRSVAEAVVTTGEPVVTEDAAGDARFRSNLSVHEMNLRSILCVPLRMQRRVLGALYLDNRFRRGTFTSRHVDLLQAFADQAAIALHNAQLIKEAEHRNAELSRAKAQVESLNEQLRATVSAQADAIEEMTARLGSEQQELVQRYRASNLVGRSKGMCEIFRLIDRVAQTNVPVLIQGETGTGKDLIAKAIHYNSPRRSGPFVSLNCAAIPAALLESELFGHVRGAFTGAVRDKQGLFEVADGGTLLLDEVGDMPVEMQAKLLRVLQEGAFRRVGEQDERTADVRVISASLHDLARLVAEHRFREDLYYRLNVVVVRVPPLRERTEEIPDLVHHFLEQAEASSTAVSPGAMNMLLRYRWPGNVRELHNELLRASALSDGQITPESLSPRLQEPASTPSGEAGLGAAVAAAERGAILRALDQTSGSVTQAAKLLGISRVVLHRKLRKYGIQRQPRSATFTASA